MPLLLPSAFTLRASSALASALATAALLTACGGGAFFVGDGVGVSVNVPPPNGSGAEVLSVVTQEPAGSNCIRGGSRVDSGIDYNRNGQLEASEVQTTRYVCNGQPATVRTGLAAEMVAGPVMAKGSAEVLVRLTAEPAGSNCPTGGHRIDAGADLDADGTLAAGEAASSAFLCQP